MPRWRALRTNMENIYLVHRYAHRARNSLQVAAKMSMFRACGLSRPLESGATLGH